MPTVINMPWTNKDMAGTVSVTIADREMTADIHRIYTRRLYLLGAKLQGAVKRNISKSGKSNGPSKAGEFPRVQTGRLRNSIFFDVKDAEMVLLVGTNLKYGLWLELGTSGGKLILPRKGQFLRFWSRTRGKWVFAKRIVQGAIVERAYLRRTFMAEQTTIKLVMEAPIPNLRGL